VSHRRASRPRRWPEVAQRLRHQVGEVRRRSELHRIQGRLAGPKILRAFAEAYPSAFFVEVGANDGHQHDHLRPILDEKPWQGIMVEPVPFVFERLRANYGDRPSIRLENVAIADRDGLLPFYHLRQAEDPAAAGLPSWYDGIGSFRRDAVLNHASLVPGLQERLACVEVPCLTFDSLCRRCGVSRVDLLLIDTEGYDHEILRRIDWNVHRPRLVVYEHYHLADEDRARLRSQLTGVGYELKEEGFDTWCLQTACDDRLTRAFRKLAPGIPSASVHADR
jgi:FkbM family methyltransferase